MAITAGVGAHSAWLSVGGTKLLVMSGNTTQQIRHSARFHVRMPLSEPGAYHTLANLDGPACSIEVMTRGVTKTLLTGEVDEVAFDMIGRTVSVAGRDKSATLHETKTSDKWLNKKTSEIVKDLAERAGIKADVKTLSTMAGKMLEQDYVALSDGESFSNVIDRIAEADNARWWLDGDGVLHYVPIGTSAGTYSIYIDQSGQPIRSDCLHLRVHADMRAAKDQEITIRSWHPRKKRVHHYKSRLIGRGGKATFSDSIPNLQQNQVEHLARRIAEARARHEITVSATVVGDPSISVGMELSLKGTTAFDQTFEMDVVSHDFGMRGHTTSLTARAARKGRKVS